MVINLLLRAYSFEPTLEAETAARVRWRKKDYVDHLIKKDRSLVDKEVNV